MRPDPERLPISVVHDIIFSVFYDTSMSVLAGIVGEDGAVLFLTLYPAKGAYEIIHHITPIDRTVVRVLINGSIASRERRVITSVI